jgi:phosphocarrier protein FPr
LINKNNGASMVGIVIVSHSAQLAKGILEMAGEMAGPQAPIAAVGGINGPSGQLLGTDMNLILQAIERVYSDDGVLILMDMGSAILNAEMAIEMLPDEKKTKVLLCSAPVVEGAIAAATSARLGRKISEIVREAHNGLTMKKSHLGEDVNEGVLLINETSKSTQPYVDKEGFELHIRLTNKHGIHARPAARLIQTVARFKAEVLIWNITENRGPANTRSLNDLMMLGALMGHELKIMARGPEVKEVVRAIEELVENHFGDEEIKEDKASENTRSYDGSNEDPALTDSGCLHGNSVSPGMAIGPSQIIRRTTPLIPLHSASNPHFEWDKVVRAWEETELQIEEQKARIARLGDARAQELFDAHLLLVRDDSLRTATRGLIFDHKHNGAHAWNITIEDAVVKYKSLGNEYLEMRAKDVQEIGRQVLVNILGNDTVPTVIETEKATILVGDKIGLSDLAAIDPKMILGVLTSEPEGLSAHAVILVKNLGIPAISVLKEQLTDIEPDRTIIIDADAGQVFVNPDSILLKEYRARIAVFKELSEDAKREASMPPVMSDGRHVQIHANIGSPAEIDGILANGAQGVGLYRTEFLFLSRHSAPDEKEQYETYLKAGKMLDGRPLVIRTLDIGGDKILPYLQMADEKNPFLGLRGVRLSLKYRDLFTTQLRAIIRTAAEVPVQIMFPMVSTLNEFREVNTLVSDTRETLLAQGFPVPKKIDIGIMVEVPSAAILAQKFAPLVDFFSIGSNDLTQYLLAAERGNSEVSNIYDALHPAILRMISYVVEAAHSCGKWVSVCGEIAGDAEAVPLLIGLGVDKLSMNSRAILPVKRVIRTLSQKQTEKLAQIAIGLESANDVRALLAAT